MVIAVIDGMGGGIGAQIVSNLREELPTYIDIYALGTNSIATSAIRFVKPSVFCTTPPKPTTIAVLSIATPESAAPLLNTLTHSLTPPLILLNIRIVAAATPANTAPSTVHLNPLKSIRIKAIGIIEITKLGRSFASLSLSSSAVSCVFNVGSLKSLPFFVKYLALY